MSCRADDDGSVALLERSGCRGKDNDRTAHSLYKMQFDLHGLRLMVNIGSKFCAQGEMREPAMASCWESKDSSREQEDNISAVR